MAQSLTRICFYLFAQGFTDYTPLLGKIIILYRSILVVAINKHIHWIRAEILLTWLDKHGNVLRKLFCSLFCVCGFFLCFYFILLFGIFFLKKGYILSFCYLINPFEYYKNSCKNSFNLSCSYAHWYENTSIWKSLVIRIVKRCVIEFGKETTWSYIHKCVLFYWQHSYQPVFFSTNA